MAILKCKMCGADLNPQENEKVLACEFCGTKQTIATSSDERVLQTIARGSLLRTNFEFDKARSLYEQLITDNLADAEIYWNIVLCKYGITYVDDYDGKKKPTINRMSNILIVEDEDYKKCLELADVVAKDQYQYEANIISEIQKEILEIANKEEPYDIFISYKETDEFNGRTRDSIKASEIYQSLIKEGYRVFLARSVLSSIAGQNYEPYIYSALYSSKIMILISSSETYVNSVWIKNEWSRFLSMMKKDNSKILIPCYFEMDPYDYPKELRNIQALDMTKLGFMQDLIEGVNKILKNNGFNASKNDSNIRSEVENQFLRAQMFLEDGQFGSAINIAEEILHKNASEPIGFLILGMAETWTNNENFTNKFLDLRKNKNFNRFLEFSKNSSNKFFNEITNKYYDCFYNSLSSKIKELKNEFNYSSLINKENEIIDSINKNYESFKRKFDKSKGILEENWTNIFVESTINKLNDKENEIKDLIEFLKVTQRYELQDLINEATILEENKIYLEKFLSNFAASLLFPDFVSLKELKEILNWFENNSKNIGNNIILTKEYFDKHIKAIKEEISKLDANLEEKTFIFKSKDKLLRIKITNTAISFESANEFLDNPKTLKRATIEFNKFENYNIFEFPKCHDNSYNHTTEFLTNGIFNDFNTYIFIRVVSNICTEVFHEMLIILINKLININENIKVSRDKKTRHFMNNYIAEQKEHPFVKRNEEKRTVTSILDKGNIIVTNKKHKHYDFTFEKFSFEVNLDPSSNRKMTTLFGINIPESLYLFIVCVVGLIGIILLVLFFLFF